MKGFIKFLFALILVALVAVGIWYVLDQGLLDDILPDWLQISQDEEEASSTAPTGSTSGVSPDKSDESGAGGNEFDQSEEAQLKIFSVVVKEDKYYCDNKAMEYDALITYLKGQEGNITVKISEENATHNAYETLIKELEELEIAYTTDEK